MGKSSVRAISWEPADKDKQEEKWIFSSVTSKNEVTDFQDLWSDILEESSIHSFHSFMRKDAEITKQLVFSGILSENQRLLIWKVP